MPLTNTPAIGGDGFSHSRFTITAICHIAVAVSSADAFLPLDRHQGF